MIFEIAGGIVLAVIVLFIFSAVIGLMCSIFD